MKSLYLDDLRNPSTEREWVVVRTFEEAVEWIQTNGCPSHISLDHDLGMILVDKKIKTGDYDAKSGYDFTKWLVESDMNSNGGLIPSDFTYNIHSSNPVGSKNMDSFLSNYLKNRDKRD